MEPQEQKLRPACQALAASKKDTKVDPIVDEIVHDWTVARARLKGSQPLKRLSSSAQFRDWLHGRISAEGDRAELAAEAETRLTALERAAAAAEQPGSWADRWWLDRPRLEEAEVNQRLVQVRTVTAKSSGSAAEAVRRVLAARRAHGVSLYQTHAVVSRDRYLAIAAEAEIGLIPKAPDVPPPPPSHRSPWGMFRVRGDVAADQSPVPPLHFPPFPVRSELLQPNVVRPPAATGAGTAAQNGPPAAATALSSASSNGTYTAAQALEEARAASQVNGQPVPPGGIFVDHQVERTTYHDFALYEYAFDPWAIRDDRDIDVKQPDTPPAAETPPPPQYLPGDLDDLAWLSDYTRLLITDFIDSEVRAAIAGGVSFDPQPLIRLVARFQLRCAGQLRRHYQPSQVFLRQDDMLIFFVEHFLADVLERFEQMTDVQRETFFIGYFDPAVVAWARRSAEMEMPWLVAYNQAQADWIDAGYVIGETFGKIPKSLVADTSAGAPSLYKLDGWVTNGSNGPEVLCHEWAWDHIRIDNGNQRSSIADARYYDRDQTGAETWFVAYASPYQPSATPVSEVLKGADDILAQNPQNSVDQLNQAIRDSFVQQFPGLLGPKPAQGVPATDRYGFRPFREGSINFGIRVLYRQAWKPRGVQPGELVRTVPLGPGQSEKVSVKIQQRNKLTRELEDVSSTETTQETTSHTTTSSELVEQAASAHKWHVDTSAQGSFTLGIVGVNASMSAGYAGETSKTSSDTKKSLNEAMQKAARVSRRENRVKVSTEREDTFEQTRSSEISNSNQEIAVTYLYETIQRIYTVETGLEAVEPVLFVGEHVPRPEELDLAWVRRYDWLLSRVLLDESFRDTLQLVATSEPDFLEQMLTAPALGLDEVGKFAGVLEKAKVSLEKLEALPGNVANTYEAALQAYQRAVEHSRELIREKQAQLTRIQRLLDHLADNILHYCRAIWSAEDPERRSMRYAALRVPTRFTEAINTQNVETDPETGQVIYTGSWEPDPNSWQQLTKLIHPAGPIGFAGNYAIYRLRRIRQTDGISRVIRIAQQAYYETLPPHVHIDLGPLGPPLPLPGGPPRLQAEVTIEDEDFYGGDSYRLRATIGPLGQLRYTLIRRNLDGPGVDITATAAVASGRQPGVPADPLTLRFDGLRLTVRGGLYVGDTIHLVAQQPRLLDPELKYRMTLEPYRARNEIEQALRDENTSDVVVDTTNLWLSLLPGDGSILEPFKRQHRQLDVEVSRTELARRLMRLHEGRLGDPDADKQIRIKGPDQLAPPVAAAEAAALAASNGEAGEGNGAAAPSSPARVLGGAP
jgi:hypothetical protein